MRIIHSIEHPGVMKEHREFVLETGRRYFGTAKDAVRALPIVLSDKPVSLELIDVKLPEWASDIGAGANGSIIVDRSCLTDGDGPEFLRCDWLKAAFLHLGGWLERSVEGQKGPIHSYAFRLPKEWQVAFDHAWVNRIYIFLRRWAAHRANMAEDELFGSRPAARFILTHDVDALEKTLPLRLKATVMSALAIARHLGNGRIRNASERLKSAATYALSRSDYWLFDEICRMESSHGFRSVFLFADRGDERDAVTWLMDPAYSIADDRVGKLLRRLIAGGWEVGIHPGFKTWSDRHAIESLRNKVAAASGHDIVLCRQHWLRFSWTKTWKAQQKAGITQDFTLGFNERSGFRNGAALAFHPWDQEENRPMALTSLPTVLMDSQFYDYGFPTDIKGEMARWVDEVIEVGGEATLLWHIHTMHGDYGWADGYEALLDLLVERQATVTGAGVV